MLNSLNSALEAKHMLFLCHGSLALTISLLFLFVWVSHMHRMSRIPNNFMNQHWANMVIYTQGGCQNYVKYKQKSYLHYNVIMIYLVETTSEQNIFYSSCDSCGPFGVLPHNLHYVLRGSCVGFLTFTAPTKHVLRGLTFTVFKRVFFPTYI